MDWVFEFDQSPHDVTVTATGQSLATEFDQLFESLCADERFEPGMLILLDLRNLDLDRVPQMELAKVSEGLVALREKCEGCALAIVATQPLAASMIRASRPRRRRQLDAGLGRLHRRRGRHLAQESARAPRLT